MKVFIVGSLNMDLTVRAPYMPRQGETLTGSGFMVTPGGKGANQAVAAGRLGGKAYMVGCVGNSFGDELVQSLEESGVDTQFVARLEDVSSGVAVIVVTDGDNRIILDKGANAEVSKVLIDRALECAEAGDYLVAQLEIGIKEVGHALKQAKEKGMVTVLNPAPAAELSDEILENSDYFLPNQTEAQFYTGIYPQDETSVRACAKALREKGVKNVIVTLGDKGAAGVCGGEFVAVDAVKVNAVDTTAAGDTFVGALCVKLAAGESVESAMKFATRASAVTVTRRGAQTAIPYLGELE